MLYTKYRPTTFEMVFGQDQIVKSLKKMLSENTSGAILLEGDRGIGKTTLALLVGCFLEVDPSNITEINCVALSGKADIDDILAVFNMSSLFGGRKLLILDEIHELSSKAQQLLLKPLEALRNGQYVIACTTSTQKVFKTLLSRLTPFKLRHLDFQEMNALLSWVCQNESIVLKKPIKLLLVEKSEGIPRQLLVNLEKLREITDVDEAKYLLDISFSEEDTGVLQLFKELSSNVPWSKIVKTLDGLLKKGNPEDIRIGLVNLMAGKMKTTWFQPEQDSVLVKSILNNMSEFLQVPQKNNLILKVFNVWKRK